MSRPRRTPRPREELEVAALRTHTSDSGPSRDDVDEVCPEHSAVHAAGIVMAEIHDLAPSWADGEVEADHVPVADLDDRELVGPRRCVRIVGILVEPREEATRRASAGESARDWAASPGPTVRRAHPPRGSRPTSACSGRTSELRSRRHHRARTGANGTRRDSIGSRRRPPRRPAARPPIGQAPPTPAMKPAAGRSVRLRPPVLQGDGRQRAPKSSPKYPTRPIVRRPSDATLRCTRPTEPCAANTEQVLHG